MNGEGEVIWFCYLFGSRKIRATNTSSSLGDQCVNYPPFAGSLYEDFASCQPIPIQLSSLDTPNLLAPKIGLTSGLPVPVKMDIPLSSPTIQKCGRVSIPLRTNIQGSFLSSSEHQTNNRTSYIENETSEMRNPTETTRTSDAVSDVPRIDQILLDKRFKIPT